VAWYGILFVVLAAAVVPARSIAADVSAKATREAYYGDLHLVTNYGFASYASSIDPDAAYRFARGEPVSYGGATVKRSSAPLDFLAVTDYAENMGLFKTLDDPKSAFSQTEIGRALRAHDPHVFGKIIDRMLVSREQPLLGVDPATANAVRASAWHREIEAANRHYSPGAFTTLIAYHWTCKTGGNDLDRIVVFSGDTAPLPFTSFDSNKPEDLWTYLEHQRQAGHDVLAIPHNPNLSNGLKFAQVDSWGKPIDRAYAQRRALNEPLVEITNSGVAETHPSLSPEDEFARFELFGMEGMTHPEGSYARHALGRGMELAQHIGVNPYAFGFVGGTDFDGLSDTAENAYFILQRPLSPTKTTVAGVADGKLYPQMRMTPVTAGSGSLTGVWAERNTREAIFAALRRKETFATSGTRLKFRFFGGWTYGRDLLQQKDWVSTAYQHGVPMGGELPSQVANQRAPAFAIWAAKDPHGANLDRLQVIKVYLKNGTIAESIYDVALSNGRQVDARTGKAPAVGNTVNLQNATYTNTIGAPELSTVWQDPQFDFRTPAAYYLRVLEIPTPRWSTIAAVQRKQPPPADVPATIQERGWSSPIWFTPAAK